MMAIEQAVADVLDETIQALSLFDLNRLQALEKRASNLADSDAGCSGNSVDLMDKKRLLKIVLQSCEANLKALNHLHRRNTRDQWAH
jgi:hypothetical protein